MGAASTAALSPNLCTMPSPDLTQAEHVREFTGGAGQPYVASPRTEAIVLPLLAPHRRRDLHQLTDTPVLLWLAGRPTHRC